MVILVLVLLTAFALGALLLSMAVPVLLVDPGNLVAWVGLILALYCVKAVMSFKVSVN